MTKLVGISGSLRQSSYNTALLRAAAGLMPDDAQLVIETIRGIPLYDGDFEALEGIPERVSELKDAIAGADGLLLVTPEYNNSIPGVFKNAIDWLSRPDSDIKRVFGGKPVAVICHGPWTLVEADVLRGRTITSWPSLQTDIRNAGGEWVDEEVVVDEGLVTSRKPDDIPAFNRKMIEEFAEGTHARQKAEATA